MRMRLMLLGGGNALGQALIRLGAEEDIGFLAPRPPAQGWDAASLTQLLDDNRPDVVINLAYYYDWFQSGQPNEPALAAQERAVERLAELCQHHDFVLLQPSSYRVFDGARTTAYSEKDEVAPLDARGQALWRIEQSVRALCPRHVLLRFGWLLDDSRDGVLGRVLQRLEQSEAILLADEPTGNLDEATGRLTRTERFELDVAGEVTEVAEAAGRNLTPVTLELGGKSPAIVDGSADIDEAAQRIAYGKLLNAGQTCIAPDYVLVPQASVQPFAMRLQGHMQHMFGTDPKNPDYSSIVSDRHYARLEALVADAAAKGATIMQPAAPNDPEWKERRKFPPTVIVDATPDMTVMQEEIFGPVLPVVGTRDAAEAIAFINKRDRPLALYWFGTDHAARDAVLARTVSGGVTVNDCLFHFAQAYQPMGGVGASGSGAYHGEWGFRTLTKLKPVFYRSRFNRLADLYPPYGAKVARLEKLMRLLS